MEWVFESAKQDSMWVELATCRGFVLEKRVSSSLDMLDDHFRIRIVFRGTIHPSEFEMIRNFQGVKRRAWNSDRPGTFVQLQRTTEEPRENRNGVPDRTQTKLVRKPSLLSKLGKKIRNSQTTLIKKNGRSYPIQSKSFSSPTCETEDGIFSDVGKVLSAPVPCSGKELMITGSTEEENFLPVWMLVVSLCSKPFSAFSTTEEQQLLAPLLNLLTYPQPILLDDHKLPRLSPTAPSIPLSPNLSSSPNFRLSRSPSLNDQGVSELLTPSPKLFSTNSQRSTSFSQTSSFYSPTFFPSSPQLSSSFSRLSGARLPSGRMASASKFAVPLENHISNFQNQRDWECLRPSDPTEEKVSEYGKVFTTARVTVHCLYDDTLFSGNLTLSSSCISIKVDGEKSPSDGVCLEKEKKSSFVDEGMKNLKKRREVSIPLISVLALWDSNCPCSSCEQQSPTILMNILTSFEKYTISFSHAFIQSQVSIFYLTDQLWRWLIVLTFQRIKDVRKTGLKLKSMPDLENATSLANSKPLQLEDKPCNAPFYELPLDPREFFVDTPSTMWSQYQFTQGHLKVTQDLIFFVSDTVSWVDKFEFELPEGTDPLVCSIHLATIKEISYERVLPCSQARKNLHILEILSSNPQKVVLAVEQEDCIPVLFQLWAVAVRSPHFHAEDDKSFVPPSLNFGGSLIAKASSKYFASNCSEQEKKWDLFFKAGEKEISVHGDMWREPHLLKLIHEGVPDALRAPVWQSTSGSLLLYTQSVSESQRNQLLHCVPIAMDHGDIKPKAINFTYEDYLEQARKFKKKRNFMNEIEKDLHRSFPDHPMFQSTEGIDSLRRVLVAFGIRNPEVGYCQSMNILCAFFLCWMDEAKAFWLLCTVVETLLVDYYCPTMVGVCLDQKVLTDLVEEYLPDIASHLESIEIHLPIVSMKWFMCLFLQCLPWPIALRCIDNFFSIGVVSLFQTALGLLDYLKDRILATTEPGELLSLLAECNDIEVDQLFQRIDYYYSSLSLDLIAHHRGIHRAQFVELAEEHISEPLVDLKEMTAAEEKRLLLNICNTKPKKKGGKKIGRVTSICVPSLSLDRVHKEKSPIPALDFRFLSKKRSLEIKSQSFTERLDRSPREEPVKAPLSSRLTAHESDRLFKLASYFRYGRVDCAFRTTSFFTSPLANG